MIENYTVSDLFANLYKRKLVNIIIFNDGGASGTKHN